MIYAFQGGEDGRNPAGTLIADAQGNLYGTTVAGGRVRRRNGDEGLGTVYVLMPPSDAGGAWTHRVLYAFGRNQADGALPQRGPLVFGKDGSLYGTTLSGGANNEGIIFRVAPPIESGDIWQESVLHAFDLSVEGADVYAGLAVGFNGSLYGQTTLGGPASFGPVFQLSPATSANAPWTLSVIYPFDYTNGEGWTGIWRSARTALSMGRALLRSSR